MANVRARGSVSGKHRGTGASRAARSAESPTRASPGAFARLAARHARWLVPTGIAAATSLAFLPALHNGFVSWDDPKNFLDNPHYRGLGLGQLAWMWTTFHMGHYIPLSWMTLGLDYVLWGMNPAGYHATSIALHAANAVVLYFLARRLFALAAYGPAAETPATSDSFAVPAALAALLFALHPLRVESVVWITERRDTLSLLFYQLSVLAYLRSCESPARWSRWYALALAAFVCALLSKATAMTLPALVALLNVYPLRRLNPRDWRSAARRVALEVAPFALLAAGFIVLSIIALHPPGQLSLAAKVAVSAYSLELYIVKTALPLGLSPLYEMPRRVEPLASMFLIAYVSCVLLAAATWALRRRWPGAAAALVAFVLVTLPMLGIVQNGPQIAADRYTYHGSPALAMLVSGALLFGIPLSATAKRATGAALVALLGLMTWRQTQVWRDSESLWSRVLAEDPNSAIGHSAMASVRYRQDRLEDGLAHSRRAVELAPDYAEAHNDLGVGLAREGNLAEAADQYRQAIAIQPTYDEAYNNLGVAVVRQGDIAAGIDDYRRALELNPDYADAHVNWGNALVRSGHPAEAIPHYQEALRIRPDHADAHHNWGVALAQQGKFAEAADQFRLALAIDPNHAEAKDYLARAMRLMNKP